MTLAYRVFPALQYDGSNGQAICDMWNSDAHYAPDAWTVTSEVGGVLVVDSAQHAEDGPQVAHIAVTFQTGDWLFNYGHVAAADFAASYRVVP